MSANEIQRELAAIRREMSATLSEMERGLRPSQLIARAVARMQEGTAGEFSHNLSRTVVENPVPVAMVAVGLAWLSGASRRPYAGPSRVRESMAGASEKAHQMGEKAHQATEKGREAMRRGAERARTAWSDQPLLIGIFAAAAGAALAGALPQTEGERELVGRYAEQLTEEPRPA